MHYKNRKIALVGAMAIFAILIGVFFVSLAVGRAYIPLVVNGYVYTITPPYNTIDSLHHFVRLGNTVTLYSNCAQLSGCNFWGFWATPFQLTQNADGSYNVIFSTSTVINEYKFVPVFDGGVDVFARHDQCYPDGCQNPPLQYIGQFN